METNCTELDVSTNSLCVAVLVTAQYYDHSPYIKSCLDCVASIEENSEKFKSLFMSPEQRARHNHNTLLIIPVKMWQSLNVWV
jgi:hypothetical protein